ncbi:MAG: MiaB/RimO family radical SAM methylthiotransferase, partial [Minisyncoccales bacterium]
MKPKYTTKFSAYVPIIIGCNNFCSYCVVPYTRGPEISRPAGDIIKEVKSSVKQGYKEIWLLGENVNSYKNPKHQIPINFANLLRMINDIPGDFWIRFTSSHPKDFSDELIKTIVKSKKITPYISLPIQSGDNEILKKMNRPYTVRDYKNLVKKIREKIPNVTLSTDIIVGFPGETKKQFKNTIKLFKEIKFDMVYISQYSPRSGTIAYKMKDTVSHQEKEKRDKVLTEVLKKTALKNNKKYIGKIVEVLPASPDSRASRGGPEYERKGWIIGKTREYKTIKFQILRGPTSLR